MANKAWIKYVGLGVASIVLVSALSSVISGPSDNTSTSTPTTIMSDGGTSTEVPPEEVDLEQERDIINDTAKRFVVIYYTRKWSEVVQQPASIKNRQQALKELTIPEFFAGIKPGFDLTLAPDKAFHDDKRFMKATAGAPIPGEFVDSVADVSLPVEITTVAPNAKPTVQSFFVTVYLSRQSDGTWLVSGLKQEE